MEYRGIELIPMLLSYHSVKGSAGEHSRGGREKSDPAEERRILEDPSAAFKNFLCVNSCQIKAGITGRNGAASALQEVKADCDFSC